MTHHFLIAWASGAIAFGFGWFLASALFARGIADDLAVLDAERLELAEEREMLTRYWTLDIQPPHRDDRVELDLGRTQEAEGGLLSLHRRNPRRDSSEPGIVRALTALGCSVQPLSGKGVPDLLVGIRGQNLLLECKGPLGVRGGVSHRGLNEAQEAWARSWRGGAPYLARTTDDAVAAVLGALKLEGRLVRATDYWDLLDVGGGSFGGKP